MTAERIDLDHLYALADGATKGEWSICDTPTADGTLMVLGGEVDFGLVAVVSTPEDAAYIAALSPDVVKGLIERVRRAEALVSEAAEEIESWGAYAGEFFQQKHDLAGTVARFRTALEAKDE